jgi:hypothetical protein
LPPEKVSKQSKAPDTPHEKGKRKRTRIPKKPKPAVEEEEKPPKKKAKKSQEQQRKTQEAHEKALSEYTKVCFIDSLISL